MAKRVYLFSESNASVKDLLGGEGASLTEMTNLGLLVPQGSTITTGTYAQHYEDGKEINDEIMGQVMGHITKMEEVAGKEFGDKESPLLVPVRSGVRTSMPGMMDTTLNLSLDEEVVEILAAKSSNLCWMWDCYRRFIQVFSDVVMEIGKKYLEELIDKVKEEKGVTQSVDLTVDDLKELANQFKAEYKRMLGQDFPIDSKGQLIEAIKAISRSQDNPGADVYHRDDDVPYSQGTAVDIQMMAFGSMGDISGIGVTFTRGPTTGEKHLMGEFLMNVQGEGVVAGVHIPQKIDQLKEVMPEVYEQLAGICHTLEDHYRDMQDMKFTIRGKELYTLQTHNDKRTAKAVLKITCDLADEGMIIEDKAMATAEPRNLDALSHPQFDTRTLKTAEPMAKVLAVSPGVTCGKTVFMTEDAKEWAVRGERIVPVCLGASSEDIEGMKVAQGILTARGGMTSHTVVVARSVGTCYVSGYSETAMDEVNKKFTLASKEFHEGDWLSSDDSASKTYGGQIKTVDAVITGELGRIVDRADEHKELKVRTDVDTPTDARGARELGAEGIDLCHIKHMLFGGDGIGVFHEMICSGTVGEREATLGKILPAWQEDSEALCEALKGDPVTIHFLDPPLYGSVPVGEEDIKRLADSQGKTVE